MDENVEPKIYKVKIWSYHFNSWTLWRYVYFDPDGGLHLTAEREKATKTTRSEIVSELSLGRIHRIKEG